jgi:hypothetical protein
MMSVSTCMCGVEWCGVCVCVCFCLLIALEDEDMCITLPVRYLQVFGIFWIRLELLTIHIGHECTENVKLETSCHCDTAYWNNNSKPVGINSEHFAQ